ncbi:MAG: phenylalanine--tRNA ligase subunit beta [Candidatus Komeilibacteria bacterium]|nr:phenylalanine--tRNA ligase subunit beta [Candidatus Komeilibacteria bacterium]
MKISLNWLKEYIDLPKGVTPQELALKLTMATVEVEEVIEQRAAFANMVVAEIMEIVDHPQADRLKVCKVKAGKEIYQVVCGGNNVYKGMKGVLALPGATVKWHGQGEPVKLEKATIRGIESFGMLCGAQEIGAGYELSPAGGVIDLPGAKAGQSAADILGQNDVIFDVDNKSITHRPDLWGHYGIAREVAAIYGLKFKDLKLAKFKEGNAVDLKINIEDTQNCSRYLGLAMSGIVIEPSPVWMQRLLIAVGTRPINNLVDITNFVMLELGRPSHAFDRRDVTGDAIIVRRAAKGEKFTTLDGQERSLTEQMCLVCDAARPVDLAGIMGGQNSEIKNDTTQIILELANFNPVNIRKTAQQLNLRTEAATRFEKSLAPDLAELGLKRIVTLIQQLIPEAKVASKMVDVNLDKQEDRLIELNLEFLNKRVGQDIPKKEVVAILERLLFLVKDKGETLLVTPPSFRVAKDISIPEDLVEEVARIYGYDNISPRLPRADLLLPEDNINLLVAKKTKDLLAQALGSTEVYNYSFVGPAAASPLGLKLTDHYEVANFLTEEQRYLRTSLFENLFKNLQSNSRFYQTINIFELGRVYTKHEGGFAAQPSQKSFLGKQEQMLAGLVAEARNQKVFLKAKGMVETSLDYLEVDYNYHVSDKAPAYVKSDRYLEIKVADQVLGWVGELQDNLCQQLDAHSQVAVWELHFELLVKFFQDNKKYHALPKYPGMAYDFSVLVDEQANWAKIRQAVLEASPLIKKVELFDTFTLEKLGPDKTSLAFHVYLADESRTLTSAEGDGLRDKIIDLLKHKFKAEVR